MAHPGEICGGGKGSREGQIPTLFYVQRPIKACAPTDGSRAGAAGGRQPCHEGSGARCGPASAPKGRPSRPRQPGGAPHSLGRERPRQGVGREEGSADRRGRAGSLWRTVCSRQQAAGRPPGRATTAVGGKQPSTRHLPDCTAAFHSMTTASCMLFHAVGVRSCRLVSRMWSVRRMSGATSWSGSGATAWTVHQRGALLIGVGGAAHVTRKNGGSPASCYRAHPAAPSPLRCVCRDAPAVAAAARRRRVHRPYPCCARVACVVLDHVEAQRGREEFKQLEERHVSVGDTAGRGCLAAVARRLGRAALALVLLLLLGGVGRQHARQPGLPHAHEGVQPPVLVQARAQLGIELWGWTDMMGGVGGGFESGWQAWRALPLCSPHASPDPAAPARCSCCAARPC
jgi:hypothetical protein